MSWHFKYPLCWNVLNSQNCSDAPRRGESWLGGGGGGGGGWWWEGGNCTPEIKSSSLRTMAWNKPCMATGSLTGMFLVWCLCAFICCLRCLGELQTVRTCGCYVKPELPPPPLLPYLRLWVQTKIPGELKKRKKDEELWGREAGIYIARFYTTLFFLTLYFLFFFSHQMKCWNLIKSETMTNQFFTLPPVQQPRTRKSL